MTGRVGRWMGARREGAEVLRFLETTVLRLLGCRL